MPYNSAIIRCNFRIVVCTSDSSHITSSLCSLCFMSPYRLEYDVLQVSQSYFTEFAWYALKCIYRWHIINGADRAGIIRLGGCNYPNIRVMFQTIWRLLLSWVIAFDICLRRKKKMYVKMTCVVFGLVWLQCFSFVFFHID